jgi:CheY-like chemotaxis protein
MPGRKILLVDDDPAVRMLLSDALTSAGYTVSTAASGPQALRLVEAEAPDLVIMDCRMPGMSGPEVVERLRQNPATRKIPVLGVAGGVAGDLDALIAAGCTECLPKPVSLNRLYEAVTALLRAADAENRASN